MNLETSFSFPHDSSYPIRLSCAGYLITNILPSNDLHSEEPGAFTRYPLDKARFPPE